MGPDEQAIRQLHLTWINAVNAGDLPRLLSLAADDVVFLSPRQPPSDRDAFSSNFLAAHQQIRIHCTSDLQEVVVVGQLAFARSRDALSVTPRTDNPQTTHLTGDRLTIYRKHPDGRWLLSRDAHTLSIAQEPGS